MTPLDLSEREGLLLTAAVHPDAERAGSSWQSWQSQSVLEEAPYSELRLLPSVYANLTRLVPDLQLPQKLRGKARAAFTNGNLMAHRAVPIIEALNRQTPVIIAKGLGFCMRFDAWALRPIRDVDIHVPFERLKAAADVLSGSGWTPHYGMTWASLIGRSCFKRASWNLAKGGLDLDLHWYALGGDVPDWLDEAMWTTAEEVGFLGRTFLVQSPEFAFASSLHHGFAEDDRGDALQTVVDAVRWLPICKPENLASILSKARLTTQYETVIATLRQFGRPDVAAAVPAQPHCPGGEGLPRRTTRLAEAQFALRRRANSRLERAVLRRPMLYGLWQLTGQRPFAERLLIRLTGAFSKPPRASSTFQEVYDLRDCETIDRLAGPGFGWPDPEKICFWSDGPDVRLLVPLSGVTDHVVILDLAESRRLASPNPSVDVFANGTRAANLALKQFSIVPGYSIVIAKACLSGPWVELSFRPNPYAGKAASIASYRPRQSLPFRTLKVYSMARLGAVLGVGRVPEMRVLIAAGKEPFASKFKIIEEKIRTSRFKEAADVPRAFDPELYVLHHADLFEAEVDPYEHYVLHGKVEGRAWR